jgi:lipopolysaccharide export system protein LptC
MADDTSLYASAAPAQPGRVALAMHQWRRRSHLIRFFRRALPVSIGLIMLILIGWVGLRGLLTNLPDISGIANATIRVTNPHFYGQDDKGRSFVIGGSEAIRKRIANREQIELKNPILKLSTGPGKTLQVTGLYGVFDQASKSVRLSGGVRLIDTASGFDFQTGEAVIDTKTGNISGNSPVSGRSPLGAVNASSYAIYDHGARVEFVGNVRSRIEQRSR